MQDEAPDYQAVMLPVESQEEIEARANELLHPEAVIGPLMTGMWGIVAAAPGVGKSMFMKMLAQGIASKDWGRCGDWIAPERRSVLLVDAEMTPHDIAERYADNGYEHWMKFTTLDLLERKGWPPFSLGNPIDQESLQLAAVPYDVIIIDNIEYTLDPPEGLSIYAPEAWKQVEPLTRWAKANNKLLIFVDHTNKEGGVQGSLSKQRGASFVITLEPEYVEKADLAFRSQIVKYRGKIEPKMKRARLWWVQDGYIGCEAEESPVDRVKSLMREGLSQAEIVTETGLSKGYVSKIYRKNKNVLNE